MTSQFIIFERDTTSYHCELIAEGIRQYFAKGEHVLTYLPVGTTDLEGFYQTGKTITPAVLGWIEKQPNIKYFEELGGPFFNLRESDPNGVSNTGGLQIAFQGEGKIAAEFFIEEMGFESLAFVGYKDVASNLRRHREFKETAAKHGVPVESLLLGGVLDTKADGSDFHFHRERVNERYAGLRKLLERMPKPLGIFCAYDRIALYIHYFAEYVGVNVPDKVNILGVGAAQRIIKSGLQAISVVHTDFAKMGYHAAELMENHIIAKDKQTSSRTLAPEGIVHRSTTSRRGVGDIIVRQAFEIIQQEPNITVAALCQQMSVPRRTMEDRFLAATNMSVGKTIDHERFLRAKQLLRSDRFSHDAIAGLAGYHNHRQMIRSFYRFVQMSPKNYVQAFLKPLR